MEDNSGRGLKGPGRTVEEVVPRVMGAVKTGGEELTEVGRGVQVLEDEAVREQGLCALDETHEPLEDGQGNNDKEGVVDVLQESVHEVMSAVGDTLSFAVGCHERGTRKVKKGVRKLHGPVKMAIKESGKVTKITGNLMWPKAVMESTSQSGGKRKTMTSEEEGMDGDDVDMREVYDAGKRLKAGNDDDGDMNPLTVAVVGGGQPCEGQ